MSSPAAIELIPESRRSLLTALKRAGWATIPQLAERLALTTEAVRQHLWQLQSEGWVTSDCGPEEEVIESPRRGRPPAEYCLSSAGDDLFPKNYSDLTIMFFDALKNPTETLAAFTDQRVAALTIADRSLQARMDALKSIYIPDDTFTEIEKSERGYRLIETNCPYLRFARERPLFCSTTVSTLRRVTGHEVVREKRFQDGDGRCVFHIYLDVPVTAKRFEQELPKDARPGRVRP